MSLAPRPPLARDAVEELVDHARQLGTSVLEEGGEVLELPQITVKRDALRRERLGASPFHYVSQVRLRWLRA